MRRDEDGNGNPFVRFKQHVDSNIASGFSTILLGFPSPPRAAPSSPSSPSPPPPSPPPTTSPRASPSSSTTPYRNMGNMDTQQRSGRLAAWDIFPILSSASYSPSALRHLPQPVPNDLPPELDSSIFTFEDAFQDLLAAAQGHSLPDIHTLYEQRKLIQRMFPSGEPTWFWMRRLESQGLMESPGRGRFFLRALRPDWEALHRELDARAADAWRTAAGEAAHDEQGAQDLFSQIGRAVRQLEQGLAHETAPEVESARDGAAPMRKPKEPDSFEDLFSSISSTFAEGQRSWDTFLKTITDQAAAHGKQQAATSPAGDAKQVETRDEYVDRYGYLHSSVTRKTLHEDDNEVGRETYATLRPADKAADRGQLDNRTSHELDNAGAADDEAGNPKSGWFWK